MKKTARRITPHQKRKLILIDFYISNRKNKPRCVEKMLLLPPFALFVLCFYSFEEEGDFAIGAPEKVRNETPL